MFEVSEMARRFDNLIRLGTVCEVDPKAARVRVKSGMLTTAWLPWLTQRAGADKTWWCPSLNEQVLILAPSGELQCGVVLCGLYRDQFPAPSQESTTQTTTYEDGTRIDYNSTTHELSLSAAGSITMKMKGDLIAQVEGQVQLQSATQLVLQAPAITLQSAGGNTQSALQGNFKIDGDLTVNGNVNATGNMLADGQNSNHHSHG